MYSGYDSNYKFWVCAAHRFQFSTVNIKILNNDLCISSNGVSVAAKTSLPSFAQSTTVNAYLTKIKISMFTINLNSNVVISSMPYIETYLNTYQNTVTKLTIESNFSISISGESSSGSSTVGITYKNTLKSKINNFMVGNQSPFAGIMSIYKSIKENYQIWVINYHKNKICFDFLGSPICINKSYNFFDSVLRRKKVQFDQTNGYQYFPEEIIFSAQF